MNFIRAFAARLFGTRARYGEDDWPSVVLLLRVPEFPEPESMVATANEAWGAGGSVKLLGTLRKKASYAFACQTSSGTMMLSIHTAARRYDGGEGKEPLEILQRPWDEHQAWMSIDSPYQRNIKLAQEQALADIYKVLLIYAFKIWSPNVLAVFFPGEGATVPNLGGLAESIQWGRRAGLDLKFLD
jgi:hypothetical protein